MFERKKMIGFRKINVDAREEVLSCTWKSEERNCDLSFANMCSWSFLYQTEYALVDGFLLVRFYLNGEPVYMMPVGEGDLASAIRLLMADARERKADFRMLGISAGMRGKMEEAFPSTFRFDTDRDYYDYLYLRTDLAFLKGKKYQAKRNHVNRFCKEYPRHEYQELTPEWIPECLRLEEEWCRMNGCNEQEALSAERRSMQYALKHQRELGITGGVLLVEGDIVAFTYGAPINHETWGVCVEKANTAIEGAYAMINQTYANHIDEKYVYINREEDLGLEGLRKAKLSYQPYCLLDKYIARLV